MQALAEKWLNKTISGEEEKEFFDWYNSRMNTETYVPSKFGTNEEELREEFCQELSVAHLKKKSKEAG